MLANRRHPLRFTLWTLLAIWLTATIAAGATYFVVEGSEAQEGRYHGQDYIERSRCTHVYGRAVLVGINGFEPMSSGETALVPRGESRGVPALIYVRRGEQRCSSEWGLDDGP